MKRGATYCICIFLILSGFLFQTTLSTDGTGSIRLFAQSSPQSVKDSTGKSIPLLPYSRIGILNPSAFKTADILGFPLNRIAGVDSATASLYGQKIPPGMSVIGDYNGPDIEKIVRLKLDLLIIDTSFPSQKLADLDKTGVPYFVYGTSPASYDALLTDLESLTTLFGYGPSFSKLKEQFISPQEKKIAQIAPALKGKKIVIIVWADTEIIAAGSDSFLAVFLARFGLSNPLKDKGWPKIPAEVLLGINPDIIIIASRYIAPSFFDKPLYNSITAVRAGKIIPFTADMENRILQPSFDTWAAIAALLEKVAK